jgi:transcriptional regulator with XRE-family HTH domain
MTFSDMLRRIIRESGITRYELSKRTGVTEGGLSRFMAGFDVTTRTIDALAKELGLGARREAEAEGEESGGLDP